MKEFLTGKIFTTLSSVADDLGLECYVVGGYVRDLLLRRPSKDIDVVVVGSGIEMAAATAKSLGKRSRLTVFKNYGTAQVKNGEMEIEFVGARRESYRADSRNPVVEDGTLEDDQLRRDFTINTLAICLNSHRFGELTDPFNGLFDLENLVIRTPRAPNITFSDDPLRMMRAVRFASQLGFFLETETFDAICSNRERINIITKERISEELNKIILSPRPSVGFILLEKSGLLQLVFPELIALKGAETREGIGHKDNFSHTLTVLDNIAKNTDNLWLRWAALLHDIGKPRVKRFEQKQGWTFHGHEYVGAKMVVDIFRKMKLPMNEKMRYVQKLVSLHMRPIVLSEDEVTDSAVRRLLFDAGDDIDDLMTLCQADITSKNPERVKRWSNNFQIVRGKLVEIEEKDRIRNFRTPIDGLEIMQTFNLPACALVGEIKTRIKDAILDGKIPNEQDAARTFMFDVAKELNLKYSE
ncbi:MAG: CCA tRNA nucleotidyltransferase [Prevotellaceae bacterium]|jgi:poly(A) polymerase|nr:CCA tRNA nucleotidyltransferase [Prevotellaceae bacterium]